MNDTSKKTLMELFRKEGALLEGHFLLSSGLHSPNYLQCARVLCHPDKAHLLGQALAEKVKGYDIEAVISPAMGGLIIGHETARSLGVRHVFAERVNGVMTLRRGFNIKQGERLLVVEDVLTTGGSLKEVLELVRSLGGNPVAAAAIVERGSKRSDLCVPLCYLIKMDIPVYPPDECPLCKQGAAPPEKPGSRRVD